MENSSMIYKINQFHNWWKYVCMYVSVLADICIYRANSLVFLISFSATKPHPLTQFQLCLLAYT